MGILLDTWWYISVHHYLAQLILSVCGLETNNKQQKKRKRNFSVFSNCVRLFSVVCCLSGAVVTIVLYLLGSDIAHQYLVGRQLVFDGCALVIALLQAYAVPQLIDYLNPEACLVKMKVVARLDKDRITEYGQRIDS